ncbi:MAG: M24 family metallopeptidase [Pseudomonadota bacterium]
MDDAQPIHLFSYGTLRLPDMQMACFGRLVEGVADAMPGYRTVQIEITDEDVLSASGERFHLRAEPSANPDDSVPGTVFRLNEADIWAADDYEGENYVRETVRLASGIDAWVYVKGEDQSDDDRWAALAASEARGLALLDAIEAADIIRSGRTELEIERDIFAIAACDFGVTAHWHDRVVRAGVNTLCVAGQAAPDRTVENNDVVFLDLGPVFGDWEADVGRSYAIGTDPERQRLVADLPIVFDAVRARFDANIDMTGAGLFAAAVEEAEARGWRFGGKIAGHLVGRYPFARSPAGKDGGRANPANTQRMRDPDPKGHRRHWILEIHLVAPDGSFAGFYERLLPPTGQD